jgi:hypothetical protein
MKAAYVACLPEDRAWPAGCPSALIFRFCGPYPET